MPIEALLEAPTPFLTDGGLETTLMFQEDIDLPCLATFPLLETTEGRQAIRTYFAKYIGIATATGRGFVLDTTTWRANTSWGPQMGLSVDQVLAANADAVTFAKSIRDAHRGEVSAILINGVVGPADDGYAPAQELTADAALSIHAPQTQALGKAGVDLISALTITHAGEAIGITRAAREIDVPAVISFTLETDGRLPSGQALGEAIEAVDAATDASPIYYMINCAHPDHFRDAVASGAPWTRRIGAIRANASRMSHAELDVAEELDDGDPVELGTLYQELLELLPNIRVVGGCCGTDQRHVGCIAGHRHALRAA